MLTELARLKREIHALTEIAKTLTTPLEISELLQAVMDKLVNVLEPAEIGVIMLWDQPTALLRPVAAFGWEFEALAEMALQVGEGLTGKVYQDEAARLVITPEAVTAAIGDLNLANRAIIACALDTEAPPCGMMAVPLRAGENKFGVLTIATLISTAEFTEADLPFVHTLADLIALAIDRARLEAEAAAIRDAKQAERLRSEVMATLSHELRTPLAAIKGYSTALLLEDIEWSENKRAEFLRLIDEESDNLQTMIGDILDSSLIDVGQLAIVRQPVRVPRLVGEIVEEIQRRTDKHRFMVDFPSDFPILDIDPRWIRQVFRNILDNALKYSPAGGLVVTRGEIRPDDVVISISDQGVGISPADLIPLFEKYFRVKAPTGYHVAGTGLGLPIARAIVEAHGGRIWAESKVGHGTTLFFSLPQGGLSSEPGE